MRFPLLVVTSGLIVNSDSFSLGYKNAEHLETSAVSVAETELGGSLLILQAVCQARNRDAYNAALSPDQSIAPHKENLKPLPFF